MKTFSDKIVVISGAASGMGRAYAIAFAEQGSLLALCDYDQKGLQETLSLINNISDKKHIFSAFDVADKKAFFDFAHVVKEQFGLADIVINNAGIEGSAKPVWMTTEQDFRRTMDVNFFGVVNGTKAFLPHFLEKNSGVLVNVSSIFGLIGTPNNVDYCASKFAVRGFTEAIMVELKETPIQVHTVHPGGIATNITRKKDSQAFSEHFLTTPAEDIVKVVMRGIRKNKPRIVFGNSAFRTGLAARLLPLTWVIKLIWREMRDLADKKDYENKLEKSKY